MEVAAAGPYQDTTIATTTVATDEKTATAAPSIFFTRPLLLSDLLKT